MTDHLNGYGRLGIQVGESYGELSHLTMVSPPRWTDQPKAGV